MLYNSRFRLFLGKLKSKWEGPYDVKEAYPLGAIKLRGKAGMSWIVNGQRVKHYLAEERNSAEVISTISEEEAIGLRYEALN